MTSQESLKTVLQENLKGLTDALRCKSCDHLKPKLSISYKCGHSICADCKEDAVDKCPLCNVAFDEKDIQNNDTIENLIKYHSKLTALVQFAVTNPDAPSKAEPKEKSRSARGTPAKATVSKVAEAKPAPKPAATKKRDVSQASTTAEDEKPDESQASVVSEKRRPGRPAKNSKANDSTMVPPSTVTKRGRKPSVKAKESEESISSQKATRSRSQESKSPAGRSSSRESPSKPKRASTGPQKIVFLGTSLTEAQKKVAKRFETKFGAKFIEEWDTEKVTHVVGNDAGGSKTTRTLKYMKGLLAHKWLVTFKWIENSLQEGSVQDETKFELVGHKATLKRFLNKPKESRENKEKIFQGVQAYFDGKFVGEGLPSKAELRTLIELGGGKVLTTMPSSKRAKDDPSLMVVVDDDKRRKTFADFKVVNASDLFQIISNFENPLQIVLTQ